MKLLMSSTMVSSILEPPPDRQGLLYKKSSRSTSYQPCWCELRGNLLFYRERSGDRGPVQLIILEGCTVELQESASEPYTFEISYPGGVPGSRSYKWAAENQETMEGGVRALSSAGIGYLRVLVADLEEQFQRLKRRQRPKLEGEPRFLTDSNQTSSTTVVEMESPIMDFARLHQEFGEDILRVRRMWQEERRRKQQPEDESLINFE
nr:sesquipedalian-1-like [Pogona vitticeps]